MLQFLNPAALAAMATVIIPLIVHLWHIRKGKTLKIGSTQIFTVASRQRATSLRIHNWPLFIIRCLLLIALSMLIAGPIWKKEEAPSLKSAWILVARAQLATAYQQDGRRIDSLLAAGATIRDFSKNDFKELGLKDSLQMSPDSLTGFRPWQLIRQLDQQLPSGFRIYAYLPGNITAYHGPRPATSLNISWNHLQTPDTVYESQATTSLQSDGNTINTIYTSSATGNRYRNVEAAASTVDTGLLSLSIFSEANSTDSRYVEAALSALSSYTGRRFRIEQHLPGDRPAVLQDFIFWLSDEEPTDVIDQIKPSGSLFRYLRGTKNDPQYYFNDQSGVISHTAMTFTSTIKTDSVPPGMELWRSAAAPVLTLTKLKDKNIYTYASRFDLQWGDQVWNDRFVYTIAPLVLKKAMNEYPDMRAVDPAQVAPVKAMSTSNGEKDVLTMHAVTDLSFACWIIGFLLFIIERLLSWYQTKNKSIA